MNTDYTRKTLEELTPNAALRGILAGSAVRVSKKLRTKDSLPGLLARADVAQRQQDADEATTRPALNWGRGFHKVERAGVHTMQTCKALSIR